MKLQNLRISHQLGIGLGIILVMVVGLGFMAWNQTERLWAQTKTLYDHPYQVRKAIGALEADILSMRGSLKLMCLIEDEKEFEQALHLIEVDEADAIKQFAILNNRYLGPKSDLTNLQDEYFRWKVAQKETIRFLQNGNKQQAISRTKSDGIGGRLVQALMEHISKIDSFAMNMGEKTYKMFTEQKESMISSLLFSLLGIVIVTTLVSWNIMNAIKQPIRQLIQATEVFGSGKLDARCNYESTNEFGHLSDSFNALAGIIESQITINERSAKIADTMLRETEAHSFCRELLKMLVDYTDSQIGAIYFLNSQRTEFELFDSIGLSAGGRTSFSAKEMEGEFGPALASGKMQRVKDIPEDSRFTFATVSGDFKPKEILTIPLLFDHETGAMISLASIKGYGDDDILLLERIFSTMTARFNGVQTFLEMRELAARLEHQNSELETQKSELKAQTNELIEMNAELEMQKKQLGEASKLKSAFLSNMSHELRTPLNSVIALSGVLNRRLAGKIPEEEHSYVEVIERNGKHLLNLINDILDLSRIESGRDEVVAEPFSVLSLVGDIVTMLSPQSKEKGLSLNIEVDKNLPDIVSDISKCRHILQNLVGNAIKFTKKGKILISAEQAKDEMLISVADTGIGISQDQIPFIFEEFRQGDGSASRSFGGTGLGLAIAEKYAKLLNGRIVVKSELNKGSTFTLQLPMALSEVNGRSDRVKKYFSSSIPDQNQTGLTAEKFTTVGHSILLVEDSEPAIIQMKDILSDQGYDIRVARNGNEALELIEQAIPDTVILDLMIPEIDGFEVLKAIRENGKSDRLPVIILTAKHVTPGELSFLKGNSIYQLIQKGDINRIELLEVVAKAVTKPWKNTSNLERDTNSKFLSKKPLILVVEDNPDNMKTMRALLNDGYRLIEAVDGQEGVDFAKKNIPDIILMDIALPVIDGFEALAAIKKDIKLQKIPIVAVTASAMKGNREEILAKGFDAYVSKPVDRDDLLGTIKRLLKI